MARAIIKWFFTCDTETEREQLPALLKQPEGTLCLVKTDPIKLYQYADSTWREVGGTAVTSLTSLFPDIGGNGLKFVRINAGQTAFEYVNVPGGGDLLSTNNLSDVASASASRDNLGLTALLLAKADLVGGKVPAAQLPAYVDDVLEYANLAALPGAGESGIIYVTLDDNKTYRWSGSSYTVISDTLALGETSATAYRGDRGKTAYDHSQASGNPHSTTIGDIPGLQTALDGKQPLDGDLTSIAALDSTQSGMIASEGAGWLFKTFAQIKSLLSLNNVTNTADADKPVSTAQAAADTDTLNAAKAYADTLVVGLIDDRGNYDASVNLFPSSGGSGSAGGVLKGDLWTISVAGTLGGISVQQGDLIRALIDTPGQTVGNWAVTENNIGYVAENQSNKDASGGYAGLTLLKINFRNVANTFTSFFTNSNTAARTYTFQDRDGTIADNTDLAGKQATLVNQTNIKSVTGINLLGSGDLYPALTNAQAFVTAETAISAATYADITGASISLATGTWLILGVVNARAANLAFQAHVAITDGSNNIVAELSQGVPASGSANVNQYANVSLSVIVSPGSTTTYKLRGARGNTTLTNTWTAVDGSGQGQTNNVSNNSDKGTGIRAIRIA